MTTTAAINPAMTEQEELAQENSRMAEATAAINEIQARRVGRQRAVDIKALEAARNELRERQAFSAKYTPRWRQQTEDHDNQRNRVLAARVNLAESKRRMPSIAEFLPADPEVIAWREHHDQLQQRLADEQAAFEALPNPEALRQELAGVMERITALTYTDQNLTAKIAGTSSARTHLEGGGNGVSDVFPALSPGGKSWILG